MSTETLERRGAPVPWRRLAVPGVLLLLGILIIALTPSQVIQATSDPVGTRFLPYVSGGAVALGGLVELVGVLMRHCRYPALSAASPGSGDGEQEASEDQSPVKEKGRYLSYALILVGILVWIYVTTLIGYALSSLVLIALVGIAFKLRDPAKIFVLAAVSVGGTYYVFVELLQVQLPLFGW